MKAKYNIKNVAQKMQMPEQALRVAIQQNRLPFAFYRQTNGRRTYYFIPHLTAQALGEEGKK